MGAPSRDALRAARRRCDLAILGPTPTAGTYTLPRLREEVLAPFQARLETPLAPQVRAIHEDGDTVIVLLEASARLRSGHRYANSYAWFFRF